MNKNQKGAYFERKVKKHFEAQGYVCYKPVWSMYGAKDIFGADLLCRHPENKQLRFIQVKSNESDLSKAITTFEKSMDSVSSVHQEVWFGCTPYWSKQLL